MTLGAPEAPDGVHLGLPGGERITLVAEYAGTGLANGDDDAVVLVHIWRAWLPADLFDMVRAGDAALGIDRLPGFSAVQVMRRSSWSRDDDTDGATE